MRAEGKKTSQGMPSAVCYPQALSMEPIKVLKINSFSSRHQRPGEICGLKTITFLPHAQRPGENCGLDRLQHFCRSLSPRIVSN